MYYQTALIPTNYLLITDKTSIYLICSFFPLIKNEQKNPGLRLLNYNKISQDIPENL